MTGTDVWDIKDKVRVKVPTPVDDTQAAYELALYTMPPVEYRRYNRACDTINAILYFATRKKT